MFEELKDVDFDDPLFSPSKNACDDPFGLIATCIGFAHYYDFISEDTFLYLLKKYKMLYDNWFHGDN